MNTDKVILYHGSAYDQNELMPGIRRSGKLVQWDETESNDYLYATTSKSTAIDLGFCSKIEKLYDINRCTIHGNEIKITFDSAKIPSKSEIEHFKIFLYSIELDNHWIKNLNPHNKLVTEYKTKSTIKSTILSKEQVDMKEWLKDKKLILIPTMTFSSLPRYLTW